MPREKEGLKYVWGYIARKFPQYIARKFPQYNFLEHITLIFLNNLLLMKKLHYTPWTVNVIYLYTFCL